MVRRAAIEACTGAASPAEELIHGHGWGVQMAHPGFVRRMKRNPDKTDYSDGRAVDARIEDWGITRPPAADL